METFHLPLHEVYARFTKSEMFLMAWRSQEQHHNLKKKMGKFDKGRGGANYQGEGGKRARYGPNDVIPDGLPDHFFNEEGEVDLSKVTGREALKYMSAIGMPFPVMNTGKPNPSPRSEHA